MTFGPIDFITLEFKGNQFHGEILNYLTILVADEVIRILDLVIVQKDEHGEIVVRELQELEPRTLQIFDPLKAEISGMVTAEDIHMIGEKLETSTTAAIMLLENLWVIRVKQDMLQANGRLVLFESIPYEEVNIALEDLANIALSQADEWIEGQKIQMVGRRARERSLVRTATTTGIVSRTAGAVQHHQQKRYAQQDMPAQNQRDYYHEQEEQYAYPPQYEKPEEREPSPGVPSPGSELMAQLEQLAALHQSGVLTDEEFAVVKQRLLIWITPGN